MKKIPYRFRLYFLPSGTISFSITPDTPNYPLTNYADQEKHIDPERLAVITRTLNKSLGQPEVYASSNNVLTLTWIGQATPQEASNV